MMVGGWRLWTQVRQARTFLRAALPAEEQGEARVTWTDRAGDPALVVPPGATFVWHLYAPPGVRFRARCAAVGCRDTVILSVEIDSAGGRRSARVSLTPSRGRVRWQTVDLPAGNSGIHEITLSLSARSAAGTSTSGVAFVAEPVLEWPRSLPELRSWLRALAGGLRPRQAMHRLRHLRRPPDVIDAYREWQRRHEPDTRARAALVEQAATFAHRPRISVITPVHNTDPVWLRACIESVRRQVYSNWELCLVDDGSDRAATQEVLSRSGDDPRIHVQRMPSNVGISAASNAAWRMATGDYVALLDHDDELAPAALFEMVRLLNERAGVDVIYGDEDKLDLAGIRGDPAFKPEWSPEYLLSCMYVGHPLVVRRSLIEDLRGFRIGYEGAQDYDLILRASERTSRIAHVAKVLYHWRKLPGSAAAPGLAKPWAVEAARRALADAVARRGLDATVEPGLTTTSFRVRHRVRRHPLVSVFLAKAPGGHMGRPPRRTDPDRDLAGVMRRTAYRPLELIVVHDRDRPPSVLRRHHGVSCQLIATSPDATPAYRFNVGASRATGEYLVYLDSTAVPLDAEWLVAMLEYAQYSAIGLVGCRVAGRNEPRWDEPFSWSAAAGAAGSATRTSTPSRSGPTPGTADAARRRLMVHNPQTVDPACFMVRRDLFQRMGGLADSVTTGAAIEDLCARVRAGGQRIVYTPYCRVKTGRPPTPLIDPDPAIL
jgi:O-antigen biosynthesis protein